MSAAALDDDRRYGDEPPPRYYGKYAGIVTDNGPPASGSHRGQVTVLVPGILEEMPDGGGNQAITLLADPAFLPGFFFVPKSDDRVWVEFVAGDINYPIWTGVWYPEDKTPKTVDGAAPTLDQKIIRTGSKSGHVIQLDDTAGAERIVIKDEPNGNSITLDSKGISVEASKSGMNVTLKFGDSTIVVDSDAVTLKKGQSTVVLDASGVAVSDATGSGTTQGVVLSPIIAWLKAHQHLGNMGAPTPLAPPNAAQLVPTMMESKASG